MIAILVVLVMATEILVISVIVVWVILVTANDTVLDVESVVLVLAVDYKGLVVTGIMGSLEWVKMKNCKKKGQLQITVSRRI